MHAQPLFLLFCFMTLDTGPGRPCTQDCVIKKCTSLKYERASEFAHMTRNPSGLIPGHVWRGKWTAVQRYLAHQKTPTLLGLP